MTYDSSAAFAGTESATMKAPTNTRADMPSPPFRMELQTTAGSAWLSFRCSQHDADFDDDVVRDSRRIGPQPEADAVIEPFDAECTFGDLIAGRVFLQGDRDHDTLGNPFHRERTGNLEFVAADALHRRRCEMRDRKLRHVEP